MVDQAGDAATDAGLAVRVAALRLAVDAMCDAPQVTRALAAEMDQALAALPEAELESAPAVVRAEVLYLQGRALDLPSAYSKAAESALARAVKLNPDLSDAWASLGHCFWKKNDLHAARDCLQAALARGPHKTALQHLSMLLRRLSQEAPPSGQLPLVAESLEAAKAAVALDVADGQSWYTLGNAYLTLFFASGCRPSHLPAALAAYAQAAKRPSAAYAPDLAFNAATAAGYAGDYARALSGFRAAGALDASLPWEREVRSIADCLTKLGALAGSAAQGGAGGGGKAKSKRIEALAASAAAQPIPAGYVAATVADVLAAPGGGKALRCRVVDQVRGGGAGGPLHYGLVDTAGAVLALALYGVRDGELGPAACVTLLDPVVLAVDVTWDGTRHAFPLARADQPARVHVNGAPLTVAAVAMPAELKLKYSG